MKYILLHPESENSILCGMSEYRLFYSPHYYAEIGEGHVFPIKKFELVRDILLNEGTLTEDEIIEPKAAAMRIYCSFIPKITFIV